MRYFSAYHRGSLKDCLETEVEISEAAFNKLVECGLYIFYAHDDRINADRFILEHMDLNYGLPTWLHRYDI